MNIEIQFKASGQGKLQLKNLQLQNLISISNLYLLTSSLTDSAHNPNNNFEGKLNTSNLKVNLKLLAIH